MIKNKGFTEISMYNYTSLIDEAYGYKLTGEFIITIYYRMEFITVINRVIFICFFIS